jgi:hypothetical protein
MISLVPHHVPRLLGFHGAGRVDMDQFSKDAALLGVGGTLSTIHRGLQDGAVAAGSIETGDRRPSAPTAALAAPPGEKPSTNPSTGGMDSTLRAATDFGPAAGEDD